MSVRHCLDCDKLTEFSIRCLPCKRAHDRLLSAAGRRRRGAGWNTKSRRLRAYWAAIGAGCIDAIDGLCKGRIQSDHAIPGQQIFVPRCAYHNNKKGNR